VKNARRGSKKFELATDVLKGLYIKKKKKTKGKSERN